MWMSCPRSFRVGRSPCACSSSRGSLRRIDTDLAHSDLLHELLRKGVAQVYVLESESGRVRDEPVGHRAGTVVHILDGELEAWDVGVRVGLGPGLQQVLVETVAGVLHVRVAHQGGVAVVGGLASYAVVEIDREVESLERDGRAEASIEIRGRRHRS